MINLMYLVLTALLALNVSAEVMNAFFTLDEGNKQSRMTVTSQLDETVKGVKDLLSDPSKDKYKPIGPAMDQVRGVVSGFESYVDDLRNSLIDKTGNANGQVDDEDFIVAYGKKVPKGKKNKDITTRMLVEEGLGDELKAKVLDTREKMLKVYTDLLTANGEAFGLKPDEIKNRVAAIGKNLTLNIDDETWKQSKDKKSWSDFKFRQMPVAAVLPLMSQMQSDAKASEAALVNSMAELSGGRVIEFDAFFPVVQAKKAYVIAGEPFEAKIAVGSYSSQISPSDIRLSVNGTALKVGSDGKANYTATSSETGKKTLKLRAEVKNPLTGEVTKGEDTYEYEVGRRSVAVSADKMNVFYIGVDNPVSVSAAGVSSNDLKVSCSGANIKRTGEGKYMVNSDKPGDAVISVSGGGLQASKFAFRVKRIPDPVAKLGNKEDGSMGNGEFKAQQGLIAWLENFDFDAKCNIQGFTLVRVPKREDPVDSENQGPRFNSKSQRLVSAAKPGDTFYFQNVKARCPGDVAGRKINSMVFTIN